MIWKVTAVFIFDKQDEANDFFHDCEVAYPKAIIINPDTDTEEDSFAKLEECHHNQDPLTPCRLISELPPPP